MVLQVVTRTLAKGHRAITIPSLLLVILASIWNLYKYLFYTVTLYDGLFFLLTLLLLLFNLQFFRDPIRIADENSEDSILSPADGVLFEIDSDTKTNMTIYRIRMRFWDVHVNYMPLDGKLISSVKKRGILLPILPIINKYSKNKNARQTMTFKSNLGFEFKVVQISGSLAYRTVAYGTPGVIFSKGAKLGMIRYGSETDLHLPSDLTLPFAQIGTKIKAGKTIIAKLKISKSS